MTNDVAPNTALKTVSEILATPIQFAKGIGQQRAEVLAKLELRTVRDVLFFFPRDYQDVSVISAIDDLESGVPASICGTVDEIELRNTGPGRSILGVLIRQDHQFVRCLWFNQPFQRERFTVGQRVLVSGTPKLKVFRWEIVHPKVVILNDTEVPKGEILPVYPLTAGISQPAMRRMVQAVVATYAHVLEEVFPESFLREQRLWPIHQALEQIHGPSNRDCLEQARRRFVFQELFVMQLALGLRRAKLQHDGRAPALTCDERIDQRIRRLFPFELTDDQNAAVADIRKDLERSVPMNRMLQGDVGSGKTVVAEYAMLLTVAHGFQAVMMAPTEVLARQHARTLAKNLAQSRVRIALLIGTLPAVVRRETLSSIASGQIDLVVGTHAVLQEDVVFAKLGLVIIDEQHKFGVRQRAKLKQAGFDPHYLVMTATPIPRTISMTLFGDLDVSTLRTPPPGRLGVRTYLGSEPIRERWWEFFRSQLRGGRQGYVITPLVDESDAIEAASVEKAFEALSNGELEAFRLGLIHGRQSAEEKDATMEAFRRGDVQVLVSTSVVEVGVDVPNATVMTIENGERFGLAQLHQLRGRIHRGTFQGHLCVFSATESEESKARLEAFCRSSDGFELAEIDFQLRGPGDLFSGRQHGLPPLRIADVIRDAAVLDEARQVAQRIVQADPDLLSQEFARLRRMVLVRYGETLDLGDVG